VPQLCARDHFIIIFSPRGKSESPYDADEKCADITLAGKRRGVVVIVVVEAPYVFSYS
jgi:hypothetical protein